MNVGQVRHGHDCPHCGFCCSLVNRIVGDVIEVICSACASPFVVADSD